MILIIKLVITNFILPGIGELDFKLEYFIDVD